jgi:hypothetical protein
LVLTNGLSVELRKVVFILIFFEYRDHFQTYSHNQRSNDSPGQRPVSVRLPSGHLLDAGGELGRPEDPSNGDRLEEAAPQDRNSAGAVEVHQLKKVKLLMLY